MGGVKAEAISPDVYRISAKLNAYSDSARLQDFLLLRAADTATAAGAVGFVIDGSADASRAFAVTSQGPSTTTASAYGAPGMAYGMAQTNYSPSYTSVGIKPGGIMLIHLVREPVPEGLRYMRAADVEAAIGPRLRKD